jgi:Ni/Co efflux regulator RcnB
MTMKKYILLAAVAAMFAPTGAVARQHGHDRHGHSQVRHDQRDYRSDRHHARTDRRHFSRNTAYRARSAYFAPIRNWSYRPVNVGYRLQPAFYGSRYYLSDYGAYHVRAPGRWQRWIRYGNDLLLVNIRTGRVLQVIHYAGW